MMLVLMLDLSDFSHIRIKDEVGTVKQVQALLHYLTDSSNSRRCFFFELFLLFAFVLAMLS